MKNKSGLICLLLIFSLCLISGHAVASTAVLNYTIGDVDQTHLQGTSDDGWSVVHGENDLPGFDMRMVGGTVNFSFDLTADPGFLKLESIQSVTLKVATVGIIDGTGYWGQVIDDMLFADGVEVPGAFDGSGYDGWELFTFPIDASMLADGVLNVSLEASPWEGWGGVDYAQLEVVGDVVDILATAVDVDPDTLNRKSNGQYITCYVFPPAGYGVRNIDASSVRVSSASQTEESLSPLSTQVVAYDAVSEALMIKLDRKTVVSGLADGANVLTITGSLTDGMHFTGSDTVTVIH